MCPAFSAPEKDQLARVLELLFVEIGKTFGNAMNWEVNTNTEVGNYDFPSIAFCESARK